MRCDKVYMTTARSGGEMNVLPRDSGEKKCEAQAMKSQDGVSRRPLPAIAHYRSMGWVAKLVEESYQSSQNILIQPYACRSVDFAYHPPQDPPRAIEARWSDPSGGLAIATCKLVDGAEFFAYSVSHPTGLPAFTPILEGWGTCSRRQNS